MTKLFSELKRRNVLRVAALYLISAWLIAQIADVVTGLGGLPPTVGRAVLVILAIGFPVALALAWIFEWTPQGIRLEADAGAAPPAAQGSGRRLDYVIIALLSVALVYFAATHDWQRPPQISSASIAVLPFENRSTQPEDAYFTDGMHDDLMTQLGKISSLVVISRTSVMPYRNSGKSLPEIASELGVATVLEGGVQRAGDRVRINLQLIDAASDKHLWAETFDRKLTAENVFAIQSEIATSIAHTLQAKLLPAEQQRIDNVPTGNLAAYDAYLLGRRQLALRKPEAFVEGQEHFARAVALDPHFALAYAGLADALTLQALYEWEGRNPDELFAAAERAARKALELDPELGEAQTSYGLVRRSQGARPEEYAAYLERGVELAPSSADARKWYANYLADFGRQEESLEQLQKAAKLDPMSAIVRINLGEALERAGRNDEALAAYRTAWEIDPTFPPALYSYAARVSVEQGLVEYSKVYLANQVDPWILLYFFLGYLDLGDERRAEQWAAQIKQIAPDSVPARIAPMNLGMYGSPQPEALKIAAQLMPTEAPQVSVPSRLLTLHDLRRGHPEAARARYAQWYPGLLGDDPQVTDDYPVAIDVAMVLKALGEKKQADRLLDRSLAQIAAKTHSDVRLESIVRARAYAVKGDQDAALRALRAAIDAGWRDKWWFYLKQDAAFDVLRDNPEFKAMLDEVRADLAGQLARVRRLEENGEIVLPPSAARGDRRDTGAGVG